MIFPPSVNESEIFARTVNAGAYANGPGGFSNIIHITVADDDIGKETIEKLYENGALLVVNGLLAGGCFS